MQTFKIENYERLHGPGTFPRVRHLADDEAESLRIALRRQLELPDDVLPKDVVLAIHDRSFVVPNVNAQEDGFDVGRVLNQFGCDASGLTYLNWHHLDDLDEMLTRDVIVNFSDIWYPSADDVELIDSRIRWVLSVHHSGTAMVLNLTA